MAVSTEKIVTRRKDLNDHLAAALVVTALVVFAVLLVVRSMYFSEGIITEAGYIVLLAGLFFGTRFIQRKNIEFEYTLMEGDLEITSIAAKRKRTRLLLAAVKDFEAYGPLAAYETFRDKPEQPVYCNETMDAPGTWFVIVRFDGRRRAYLFQPSDDMIIEMKRRSPQKEIKGE